MIRTRLIVVPYVLGVEGKWLGAGPLVLEGPLTEALRPARVERLRLDDDGGTEVGRCFELNRRLARSVAAAVQAGEVPVVLTGNCHSQQAVVAGLGADGLGLAWFDCHADFHTPDTTESGFFDAFALSMIAGDCWTGLCAGVPGFAPLPMDRVLLCGVRDVDAGERARLDASAVREVAAAELPARLGQLPGVRRVSVHVDLDALDPGEARANAFATPGGLSVEELAGAVRGIAQALPIAALTLSAYDPSVDPDGAVVDAAVAISDLG